MTDDSASVSDGVVGGVVGEPVIKVLKGNPTDADVAALVAVLGTAGGGEQPAQLPTRTNWGLPVDKLRYSPFSWQVVTMVQRVHMRR